MENDTMTGFVSNTLLLSTGGGAFWFDWVCCVCSSEEEDRGRSGRMEGYIEDEGV